MSSLSTHVLDAALGRPAVGVSVELRTSSGEMLGAGRTDQDGRITSVSAVDLAAGCYELAFDTGAYFAASGTPGFYPHVRIAFETTDEQQHYHVPLLLSPFAYSTYRGS